MCLTINIFLFYPFLFLLLSLFIVRWAKTIFFKEKKRTFSSVTLKLEIVLRKIFFCFFFCRGFHIVVTIDLKKKRDIIVTVVDKILKCKQYQFIFKKSNYIFWTDLWFSSASQTNKISKQNSKLNYYVYFIIWDATTRI